MNIPKDLQLGTITRYLVALGFGYLGSELTEEELAAFSTVILLGVTFVAKTWLKPIFYKFGERQPGDTRSGDIPTAPKTSES